MKQLKSLALVILLFSFCISCSSNEDMENLDSDSGTENTNVSSYEQEILDLINAHRTSNGLSRLALLDAIKTQTNAHTDYMINAGAISHDNFNQRSAYLRENADARSTAENVASGYSTAQAVVNGWLNSQGHRQNIEGNYTHFHLTAKQSGNNRWYYTNIFIRQ